MRILLRMGTYFLATVPLFLFGFFLFWLVRVVMPVVFVEAHYQYRTLLKEVFHTTSLAGILVPKFTLVFDPIHSKYKSAGISIPKIYLDEPVIFNVDPNNTAQYAIALKKGIAHASATSFPGQVGIGYYFAHSSSAENVAAYNAVFYLLGKLEPADEVFLWKDGTVYSYTVTTKAITAPEDISFLKLPYPDETIVLQTCWPPGTSEKRLLVFAQKKV